MNIVCDASVSPQAWDEFESGYYCSENPVCRKCRHCNEHCTCGPVTSGEAWLFLAGAFAAAAHDEAAMAIIFEAQQYVFLETLMEKVKVAA